MRAERKKRERPRGRVQTVAESGATPSLFKGGPKPLENASGPQGLMTPSCLCTVPTSLRWWPCHCCW
ncbi:hypothetical protein UPYG_G00334340 [Umbra pygmaea]|uniref:Uncharacterized protein n=1 Tax=Umbra pygmaea TaxID=75934 RepID=A0ABD0VXL8_UMBPY